MSYVITLIPSNISIPVSQALIITSNTLSQKFTDNQLLNAFKKNITIQDTEIVVTPEVFKEFILRVDKNLINDEYILSNIQKATDFLYISKYLKLKTLTRRFRDIIRNIINDDSETCSSTLGYTENYTGGLKGTLSETYFCWEESS